MRPFVVVTVAIAVALLGVLGVSALRGEAPEAAPPSDSDLIQNVIYRAFVQSDPAHCGVLHTQAWLDQVHFGTGTVAVSDCKDDEADPSEGGPDSVSFADLTVENGVAAATVRVHGGALDRSVVEVELVDEDGSWRLDRLVRVDIDRGSYDRYAVARMTDGGSLDRPEARCYLEAHYREVSLAELERAAVTGDEPPDPEFPAQCFHTETLREMLIDKSREAGEERDASAAAIDCVETRLRRLPEARIRAAFAGDAGDSTRALYAEVIPPCAKAAESASDS